MDKNKRLLRPGSRLSLLENMLVEPYRMVWDCCCDHGLLGMSLLKRSRASEVIFVDVLEEFKNYRIVLKDLKPAGNGGSLYIRLSGNGGSNWGMTSDVASIRIHSAVGQLTNFTQRSTSYWRTAIDSVSNSGDSSLSGTIDLLTGSSAHATSMGYHYIYEYNSVIMEMGSGRTVNTTAPDSIQFYFNNGNIASGTIEIYEV